MSKRQTWRGAVLAAGLALATVLTPVVAQTEGPRKGDSQKPVVNTYDKQPDPSGKNQDLDAVPYVQENEDVTNVEGDEKKPVIETYDKKPDPKGDAQKLDAVRYDQDNEANDGQESQLEMKVLEGSVEE